MKINIKELHNLPEKQVSINFEEVIDELENNTPVKAILTATVNIYGINLKGRMQTDIKLSCDRCLQEFDYHIDTEINEDFVNNDIVPDDKKEYELKGGEFAEELKGREEIDITDLLYQTAILEIPTKKICKDSCSGSEAYQKIISEKFIDERLEVFKSFSENNFSE